MHVVFAALQAWTEKLWAYLQKMNMWPTIANAEKQTQLATGHFTWHSRSSDWLQFYKERHHLEAFAVVAYNKIGFMNVVLEKIFSQTRIRKFSELEKAVQWVEQLSPGDQVVIDDEEDTAAFN